MDIDRIQQELFQALFTRLDSAFPEFGFKRKGGQWQASNRAHTKSLPGAPRPERVEVSDRAPWGFMIHGGSFVPWLQYVNGGASPKGPQFWERLRALSELAGVPIPEPSLSPEQCQRFEAKERRKALLDGFFFHAHRLLQEGKTPEAAAARRYLIEKRGFEEEELVHLDLGVYQNAKEVGERLAELGFSAEDIAESGLTTNAEGKPLKGWQGRLVGPWRGRYGEIQTLFARDITGRAEDSAKYLYLRGSEKGKLAPFGLFEAMRTEAGREDLVLVEGLMDVIAYQARGFTNIAGLGGSGSLLTPERWGELARLGVRSVTLAFDNDEAGLAGLRVAVENAVKVDKPLNVYVLDPLFLQDCKDPDEYLREHHGAIIPFQQLLEKKVHAFRFHAHEILRRHQKGHSWSDAGLKGALDEAIVFDGSVRDPEKFADLERFFWQPIMDGTGADYDALVARREAIREKQAAEQERQQIEKLLSDGRAALAAGDLAQTRKALQRGLEGLPRADSRRDAVRSVAEELHQHEEKLERWRGSEYIGLPQRTLPRLDDAMSGLRGLMLLAAMPNVGKTALAVQLGLDVVEHNPDACFLFLSLEMSRWDIMSRIKCRLARMSWKTLVFGNAPVGYLRGRGREVFFTQEEFQRLHEAEEKLRRIGQRIRILDERNFPGPTVDKVLAQLADLKARTGAARAFLLVDYLQVWPIPEHMMIRNELEADRWRIGNMKTLRDAAEGDAILAISEARKPSESGTWGSNLADVMGSARGTYTPDVVFLFQNYDDDDLAKMLGLGPAPRATDAKKKKEWDERLALQKRRLQEAGMAYSKLVIAKGRDGVLRDTIDMSFHFRESRFEQGATAPWRVSGGVYEDED